MTAEDAAKKLISMGKKGYAPNYQDNKFFIDAGRWIMRLRQQVSDLQEKVYDLEERLAIREEMDHQGDPEIDNFPPQDDCLDTAAPGEAAEDFWGDDWPLDP